MCERLVGFDEHLGGAIHASEHDEVQRRDADDDLELPGKIEWAERGFFCEGVKGYVLLRVILDVPHCGVNTLEHVSHFSLATCDQRYVKSRSSWLI